MTLTKRLVLPLGMMCLSLAGCGGEATVDDDGDTSAALSSPVVISSPASGATVTDPVTIAATVSGVGGRLLQVYDNGAKLTELAGTSIDKVVTLTPGAHKLTVQELGTNNAVLAKASINVTVRAAPPPVVRYSYRCFVLTGPVGPVGRELPGIDVNSDGTDLVFEALTAQRFSPTQWAFVVPGDPYDPPLSESLFADPSKLLNGISTTVQWSIGYTMSCVVQ